MTLSSRDRAARQQLLGIREGMGAITGVLIGDVRPDAAQITANTTN